MLLFYPFLSLFLPLLIGPLPLPLCPSLSLSLLNTPILSSFPFPPSHSPLPSVSQSLLHHLCHLLSASILINASITKYFFANFYSKKKKEILRTLRNGWFCLMLHFVFVCCRIRWQTFLLSYQAQDVPSILSGYTV